MRDRQQIRLTKTQRIARRNFSRDWFVLDRMEVDFELPDRFPVEWHMLETDIDLNEPKDKVTLYLDRSVARMFKGFGKGWHGVANRVLRCWMQAKMADMLEMEKSMEWRRDRIQVEDWEIYKAMGGLPGNDDDIDEIPDALGRLDGPPR